MHSGKAGVLVFVCCVLSATALAQDKWGGYLDFEAKPGTKRSLGEGDLFVPLWQDSRSLLFGNLRARFDDNDGREGNLGLGLRRMLDGGWNLGGYGYLDRRKTGSGSYFNQATLGAEALGRDWDLRANAYLPHGDRVRDLGSTTTGGGESSASIVGTTVLVTTPGATTVMSEERALPGFDFELGWRVPFFEADAPRQLRVYAGGYYFRDDVAKVDGPRVRAELAMYDLWKGTQLLLGAEYQDDQARGGQGFLSLRLRIPLGSREASPGRSWQQRRMTAPVVRDIDIVTQARSVVTGTTPATVEAASATADGQAIMIVDSGTTTGADLPVTVGNAGINSVVLLSGTFDTNASVVLQTGQTLMGAGSLQVRTVSGRTAVLNTPAATINLTGSGGNFRTIVAANNTTITGLNITATSTGSPQTSAILLDGVFNAHNVRITNNVLASSNATGGRAQAILLFNVNNAFISGNTLSGSATGANESIGLHVISSSATVTGNSMAGSGSATNYAVNLSNATILSGSSGNVQASGACNVGVPGTGAVGFTNGSCP